MGLGLTQPNASYLALSGLKPREGIGTDVMKVGLWMTSWEGVAPPLSYVART